VSGLATNYQVVIEGYVGPISGTSASTPVFAGLIALINDELIKQGKPVLGFLNPLLYQLNKVGNDIVKGNNKQSPCPTGFSATNGWDAITGLGSPNFDYLFKQIVKMDTKNLANVLTTK